MLVTLESLIDDNINTNDEVVDMESLEFDITDTIMECSELSMDINTLVSASTVIENVQMEGFGEKIKEIFKVIFDKILDVFKKIGIFIHKCALKLKYKFGNDKVKKDIIDKLSSDKQNKIVNLKIQNPILYNLLTNDNLNADEFKSSLSQQKIKIENRFDSQLNEINQLLQDIRYNKINENDAKSSIDEIINNMAETSDFYRTISILNSIIGFGTLPSSDVLSDDKTRLDIPKLRKDFKWDGETKDIQLSYKELNQKYFEINKLISELDITSLHACADIEKSINKFVTKIQNQYELITKNIEPESLLTSQQLRPKITKMVSQYINIVTEYKDIGFALTTICSQLLSLLSTLNSSLIKIDKDFENFDINNDYTITI